MENCMTGYKTVSAEFMHVMCSQVIPDLEMLRMNMELDTYRDLRLKAMVLSLSSCVTSNKREPIDIEEHWPADWWQAFRERWFPAWWLRRWPIKFNSVEYHDFKYTRCCPHVGVKAHSRHVQFVCADNFSEDSGCY